MSNSKIQQIVDYTAVIAAGIEGVKSIHAAGQNFYDDPLRPGHRVEACPGDNSSLYAHWSGVPSAPGVEWVSQSGTVEMTWNVPLRLWLPKNDSEAIRAALPYYDRYLQAYISNHRLNDGESDLALRTAITMFRVGGSPDWSWLDVTLNVVERVNYFA